PSPTCALLTGTSPPAICSLSLHDALPIFMRGSTAPKNSGPNAGPSPPPGAGTAAAGAGTGTAVAPAFFFVARFGAAFFFGAAFLDRKSTRLNSSHVKISYAVFCLKKKKEV